MIWNTIPNNERLRLWKSLRDEITSQPLLVQLSKISLFCSNIPFGARTLDYYSAEQWPTPWEILFHGSFCTSSISLLIFYTLVLLPGAPNVDLHLVEDDTGLYLLPVVNNQFVLNYELGQISMYSEVCNSFKTIQKFTQDQIKTIT